MEEQDRYERAKKRVKELKSFYGHLVTYVAVMLVLFFVDCNDQGGTWWFYWPLLGWGIAVAVHAFETFATGWEERKIKELMKKDSQDEG